MKKNRLFSIFLATIFIASMSFAQNDAEFIQSSKTTSANKGITSQWNLQFQYPVIAGGTAGIECDGTNFFITKWNGDLFYKYDMTGNLLDSFTIAGVSAIRDLAYDGTYFYGGSSGNTIYKMDFASQTLISTITSPSQTVRSIAYDPVQGAFWVGNWDTDNFALVDTNGTQLATLDATVHGLDGIYGSAIDYSTPFGPYLWVTNANGQDVALVQIHIGTGLQTGLQHVVENDVSNDGIPGSGGGLFIEDGLVGTSVTIGGLVQNEVMYGYNLQDTETNIKAVKTSNSNIKIYPNPAKTNLTIESKDAQIVKVRLINLVGQSVLSVDINSCMSSVDLNNVQPGAYMVEVTTEQTTLLHKIIVK